MKNSNPNNYVSEAQVNGTSQKKGTLSLGS